MSYKTRTARRRLRCDHCRKPIEIGALFQLVEKWDEYGKAITRYHEDCKLPARSSENARKLFGEA